MCGPLNGFPTYKITDEGGAQVDLAATCGGPPPAALPPPPSSPPPPPPFGELLVRLSYGSVSVLWPAEGDGRVSIALTGLELISIYLSIYLSPSVYQMYIHQFVYRAQPVGARAEVFDVFARENGLPTKRHDTCTFQHLLAC
jgi:hypothetical protein